MHVEKLFTMSVSYVIVNGRSMRQKKSNNIDDFVVRRRPTVSNRRMGLDDMRVPSQYLVNPDAKQTSSDQPVQQITSNRTGQPLHVADRHSDKLPPPQTGDSMSSNGIDMTLDGLDVPQKKKKRRFFHKPSKRTVKIVSILLLLIILSVGAFFAWKIFSNAGRVFNGNPLGAIFGNKELKKDANGRTNVLIFGTSEDDPGHDGANLTDSIMVASVDQKKKDAYLLSIPRDLWVKFGKACNSGYEGKINEVYLCGKTGADENGGQTALRTKISEVTGLDLQYSVHINYTVLKEAVDAVGGVDVVIDSPDPRGILDRNFDWNCPGGRSQSCYNVKYPNGPVHLDGLHALYLARARGDDPLGRTYGLGGGNFDREKYQQKILIALKGKATSAGTLANPIAVTQLLDSMGNNVRTNIDAEEIKSFIALTKDIKPQNIHQLTLVDKTKPLVTTGNYNGVSIVRPVAGIYDFSAIKAYVLASVTGDTTSLEGATIDVRNGSGVAGTAQKQADKLTAQGLTVDNIGNVPAGTYAPISLYDQSAGKKPGTKAKLERILGVKSIVGPLPTGVTSTDDFVIIVGNGSN